MIRINNVVKGIVICNNKEVPNYFIKYSLGLLSNLLIKLPVLMFLPVSILTPPLETSRLRTMTLLLLLLLGSSSEFRNLLLEGETSQRTVAWLKGGRRTLQTISMVVPTSYWSSTTGFESPSNKWTTENKRDFQTFLLEALKSHRPTSERLKTQIRL